MLNGNKLRTFLQGIYMVEMFISSLALFYQLSAHIEKIVYWTRALRISYKLFFACLVNIFICQSVYMMCSVVGFFLYSIIKYADNITIEHTTDTRLRTLERQETFMQQMASRVSRRKALVYQDNLTILSSHGSSDILATSAENTIISKFSGDQLNNSSDEFSKKYLSLTTDNLTKDAMGYTQLNHNCCRWQTRATSLTDVTCNDKSSSEHSPEEFIISSDEDIGSMYTNRESEVSKVFKNLIQKDNDKSCFGLKDTFCIDSRTRRGSSLLSRKSIKFYSIDSNILEYKDEDRAKSHYSIKNTTGFTVAKPNKENSISLSRLSITSSNISPLPPVRWPRGGSPKGRKNFCLTNNLKVIVQRNKERREITPFVSIVMQSIMLITVTLPYLQILMVKHIIQHTIPFEMAINELKFFITHWPNNFEQFNQNDRSLIIDTLDLEITGISTPHYRNKSEVKKLLSIEINLKCNGFTASRAIAVNSSYAVKKRVSFLHAILANEFTLLPLSLKKWLTMNNKDELTDMPVATCLQMLAVDILLQNHTQLANKTLRHYYQQLIYACQSKPEYLNSHDMSNNSYIIALTLAAENTPEEFDSVNNTNGLNDTSLLNNTHTILHENCASVFYAKFDNIYSYTLFIYGIQLLPGLMGLGFALMELILRRIDCGVQTKPRGPEWLYGIGKTTKQNARIQCARDTVKKESIYSSNRQSRTSRSLSRLSIIS